MRPLAASPVPVGRALGILAALALAVTLVWFATRSLLGETPIAADRTIWYAFFGLSAAAALVIHLARRLRDRIRARHDDEPALWI